MADRDIAGLFADVVVGLGHGMPVLSGSHHFHQSVFLAVVSAQHIVALVAVVVVAAGCWAVLGEP